MRLTWLQSPDEQDRYSLLEYLRGVVYGLSASRDGNVSEIHVSRISNVFSKLGQHGNLYRVGLRLLVLFREIESLFGGYWLLTPFRVVEVENRFLFVGAIPEVHGFLGPILNVGLARFVEKDIATQFPRQSIEGWMGIEAGDPATLVASFLEHHESNATPTISHTDLEYLTFVGDEALTEHRFAWLSRPSPLPCASHVALCRQKVHGSYRYFSAGLRSGRVTTEAPVEQSVSRLTYALGHYCQMPVVARATPGQSGTAVTVPERLPVEEYRLALLLADQITRRGNCSVYTFSPDLASYFIRHLRKLGCAVEVSA